MLGISCPGSVVWGSVVGDQLFGNQLLGSRYLNYVRPYKRVQYIMASIVLMTTHLAAASGKLEPLKNELEVIDYRYMMLIHVIL